MSRLTARVLILISCIASVTASISAVEAVTIEMYHHNTTLIKPDQIDGNSVTYHDVSAVWALERNLGSELPDDVESAKYVARNRITDDIRRQIVEAWAVLIKMRLQKVKYVPAIVFDESYVYYGHDLRRAINLYQGHLEDIAP